MAEAEEKLLRDYFQEIAEVTEHIPDFKLDTAIRSGIRGGRQRKREISKGYVAVFLVVMAAVLFGCLSWVYGQVKPQQAVLTPKSWGALEVYREAIGDNLTVTSALDAGFVQQMDIVSPEVGGFQMTINGVIADRRGVILLYTLDNRTGQKYVNLRFVFKKNDSSLTALNSENFGFAINNSNYRPEDPQLGATRDVMLIPWEKLQNTLPGQIFATLTLMPTDDKQQPIQNSSGEVQLYRLNTMIDLDESAGYSQGASVELKDGLTVAGQTIRMRNVYIGPTGIYMNESYEDKNTMKIFGDYGLKMVRGTGAQQKVLTQTAGYSYNGGPTNYIFDNDNMHPGDPIRMDIEGLYAMDKSKMEVVINTETREILQAPDDRLSLSERMADADPGTLILDLTMPYAAENSTEDSAAVNGYFSLDPNFVDAEGSGHWLTTPEENGYSGYKEYNNNSKGNITTAFYSIGTEKLPQPLTFKLSYYPCLILESDHLRIR